MFLFVLKPVIKGESEIVLFASSNIIGLHVDKENFRAYNCKYFLTHQLKHVLGAQKNCLIETVLLSTHNMFWLRNKKIIFCTHS